jgi:uncharacterized protein VcgC/VcgE DUF2780
MFIGKAHQLALKKGLAASVTLLAAVACGGKNPAPSGESALPASLNAAAPLLNAVSAAVPGLSQAQTALGLGSLFGLARQKMPADQYAQVTSALPGSDALVTEAMKHGLPSNLGGLPDVTGFLAKSGISVDQVSRMIPAIGNSMAGRVPPETGTAFFNALK